MFEITVIIFLGIIASQLYCHFKKSKILPQTKYYFEEENYLSDVKSEGTSGEFYLYTVAQFNERVGMEARGLVRELGFSDFVFIFDKNTKRFLNARVKFIGSDGFDRGKKIGYYHFHLIDDAHIEINIHLNLKDYNDFFNELRIASDMRKKGMTTYFLYSLNTTSSINVSQGNTINSINAIHRTGVYSQYHSDKIGVMVDLAKGLESSDIEQKNICTDLYDRFMKINAEKTN
jgi:hypothetical protein